jgi:hypothetical protein
MAPDDDSPPKPDPKVKELLGRPLQDVVDEITAKELERWFGLPSFAEVEEAAAMAPARAEDPDLVAVRERRKQAIAAVDPRLLDSIDARTNVPPEKLLAFEAKLDVHVDASIAQLDLAMIDSRTIAEPRRMERPLDIEEELQNNTPQALLRDLHRPEFEFEKVFEVVDMAAAQTMDAVAVVDEAMRTNWKLPPLVDPKIEVRRVIAETRAEIRSPWTTIPTRIVLPNRRVTE